MSSKDYDGAIAAYGEAIKKDASNPVYYSNRAAAFSQINKHELAIADAKKAAEVDPSFSKAYRSVFWLVVEAFFPPPSNLTFGFAQ